MQHLTAAERQQLAGQRRRLVGRVGDLAELLATRHVLPGEQQLRVAGDDGQQVVEVVRDAAREAADRLQLLRQREPLLEPQPLGHVVREHERRPAALHDHPAGGDLDVDHRAVLGLVTPHARHRRARPAAVAEVGEQRFDVLSWPDVLDRHAQELLARVAVVPDRGLVDGQEAQRLGVVDPHRERARLEQQPVALLGAGERADEAGVLDRVGDAAAQLGGDVGVLAVERPAARRQGDRAQRAVARHQRHADVGLAACRHELRFAGAHDHGRAVRAVVLGRPPPVGERGDALDRAVLLHHVDRAPFGEAAHEQGGEALQRVIAGPGRRQQLARAREEREPVRASSLVFGHRHRTGRERTAGMNAG